MTSPNGAIVGALAGAQAGTALAPTTTDPVAAPSITDQGAAQATAAGGGGSGGDQTGAGPFMLKASATFAVFLVLGLIAATGPNAAKFAAGVGGLMTLGIVLNQASNFSGMVSAISSAKAPAKTPVTAPAPAPNAYSPAQWNPTGTVPGSEVAGTPASLDTSNDATTTPNQGGIPGLGGFSKNSASTNQNGIPGLGGF